MPFSFDFKLFCSAMPSGSKLSVACIKETLCFCTKSTRELISTLETTSRFESKDWSNDFRDSVSECCLSPLSPSYSEALNQ